MLEIRLTKAEGLRRALVLLFYAAFAFVMIWSIRHAANEQEKYLSALLCLAIPLGLWNEYLRRLYEKCSLAQNSLCDPGEAVRLANRLDRLDLFRRYRKQAGLLRGFASLDLGRAQDAEAELKKIENILGRSAQVNFEYQYLSMLTHLSRGRKRQATENYQEIKRIFSLTQRMNRDLASLEKLVTAVYYLGHKNPERAKRELAGADRSALGVREQVRYLECELEIARCEGASASAEAARKTIAEMAPHLNRRAAAW